jgi:hypothetical protein
VIDCRLGVILLQMTLQVGGGVFVVTSAYVYMEVCFTESGDVRLSARGSFWRSLRVVYDDQSSLHLLVSL